MDRTLPTLTVLQSQSRASVLGKLADGTYWMEAVPACVCGARNDTVIADHDRFDIPVGVVLCNRCGLARTTPRLASANLPAFYEDDYHGLHQGVRDPSPDTALFRRGQGRLIHSFIADLLPPGALRVADIGCGTGQVLREFEATHDRQVVGVGCEYAREFVAAGRRAGSDIRHGGPDKLTDAGPFDLVIMSHVVEHFPDPVAELASIRRLGHSATLFYVEVPGLLTIDRKPEYVYRLTQYLTLAHTFHFTLQTLADMMQRAGFDLVRGDETVRSVFTHGPASEPPERRIAPAIFASLHRLDTSFVVRMKRATRLARLRLALLAKAVLPDRVVAAIRARRLRG